MTPLVCTLLPPTAFDIARIGCRPSLSFFPFATLASCTKQQKIIKTDNAMISPLASQDGHRHRNCHHLETNLASHWEGVRLPRPSGKSPDFPGSSPNFPGSFSATSRKSFHCGTLQQSRVPQKFPRLPPKFPGGSPGSFPDFPEVSPFSGKPDTLS